MTMFLIIGVPENNKNNNLGSWKERELKRVCVVGLSVTTLTLSPTINYHTTCDSGLLLTQSNWPNRLPCFINSAKKQSGLPEQLIELYMLLLHYCAVSVTTLWFIVHKEYITAITTPSRWKTFFLNLRPNRILGWLIFLVWAICEQLSYHNDAT